MSNSSLLKILLNVVRCETILSAETHAQSTDTNFNDVSNQLFDNFDRIRSEMEQSSWKDVDRDLGAHFLRCCSRLVSFHFLEVMVKRTQSPSGMLHHPNRLKMKLDILIFDCLRSYFRKYMKSNTIDLPPHIPHWSIEQLQPLKSMVVSCIFIFDSLSKDEKPHITRVTMTADQEHLLDMVLEFLLNMFVSLFSFHYPVDTAFHNENDIPKHAISLIASSYLSEAKTYLMSDYLASFLHSNISFLTYQSKSISSKASHLILIMITAFPCDENILFWKKSFPGTFSGLCGGCKHHMSRGGKSLFLCLTAMIKLMELVCDHREAENHRLVLDLYPNLTNEMGLFSNSTALLKCSSDGERCQQSEGLLKFTHEWRATLIQKIELIFPTIYRSAVSHLLPKQRERLLSILFFMINRTSIFMGSKCYFQFLLCFMIHYHDDDQQTRSFCREKIGSMIIELQNNSQQMALEVQDNYLSYFFETLEVAGRLSNSLNSGFVLPQQLSQLIAVGNCLQRKIKFGITADEVTFTASLIELYSMDYKAQKAMLLETRRYFPLGLESNASSFDGSHFRLPWAATNDPTVKGLLREFAVLCGEYGGDFEFVANSIKINSRKIDKLHWETLHSTLIVSGSDHRVEKHTKLCSDMHGLLNFIRYALFGRFARYSDQSSVSSPMDNASCLVCGARNCKLRCSRCKFVHYCSKAHQSEDWKNHKLICEDIMEFSGSKCRTKVDDPDILLFHQGGVLISSSESSEFFIDILELYTSMIRRYLDLSRILSSPLANYIHPIIKLFYPTFSICTAQAIEAIGDFPLFLSLYDMKKCLNRSLLFELVEVIVIDEIVTCTAAKSTLSRISLYLAYASTEAFLRDHLDFVVEDACARFRTSFYEKGSLVKGQSKYSLDSVVDSSLYVDKVVAFVFDTCGIQYSTTDTDQRHIMILRDMVMNTLKHVDSEVVGFNKSVSLLYLSSMIEVLHVLGKSVKVDIPSDLVDRLFYPGIADRGHMLPQRTNELLHSERSEQPLILRSLVNFDHSLTVLSGRSYVLATDVSKEQKSQIDADEIEDRDDTDISPSVCLLEDICDRIGYFIMLPCLKLQSAALEVLSIALLGLSNKKSRFLPTIHRIWPFLAGALLEVMEHSCAHIREWDEKMTQKSNSPIRSIESHEYLLGFGGSENGLANDNFVVRHELPGSCHQDSSVLYLLPSILRVVSQLVILVPDFVSTRIDNCLLPKVFTLMYTYMISYVSMGTYGVAKRRSSQKYSLDSKVKLSIIGFVKCLLVEPILFKKSKSRIKAFYFFILPWVSHSECNDVQVNAAEILGMMESVERSFIYQIRKNCIQGLDRTQTLKNWNMIIADPALLGGHESVFSCSHSQLKMVSTTLWELYQQDDGVQHFLHNLAAVNTHMETFTKSWNRQITGWSKM